MMGIYLPRLAVKGHAVYTVDLATILQLLREFRRSGILRTEIPAGLPRLKKPCFVFVELRRGEIVVCYVKDAKGQTLLSGQEAFRAVAAVGKLNWVFDEQIEQEGPRLPDPYRQSGERLPTNTGVLRTPPAVPIPQWSANSVQRSPIPRRLFELNPADMYAWPRRHRQVYVLIDGTRSVEQIASMLSQPPQLVETVLREIQSTGAITLEG
jgi:hypothetical protein